MANILGDEKKEQVFALGRLGWPLRRIEQATGVRRETASAYLKAAGITIRAARHRRPPPNPASEASTDLAKPADCGSQLLLQPLTDAVHFVLPRSGASPQCNGCAALETAG